ncbi:T9SS type B sorting domain-containing protein, partial [Flavobacterium noncentrifugens]
NFPTPLNICSGDIINIGNTSPNGVVGTWSSAFSNTVGATYTFTPNAGQCAVGQTLTIAIRTLSLPAIAGTSQLCEGTSITLSNTVPGGIWASNNTAIATIDASGTVLGIAAGTAILSYTIASGSCSLTVFHTVNVHPLPKPKLTDQNFCIDSKTGLFISDIILNCAIPNSGYSFVWTRNSLPLPTTGNSHVADEAGIYEVVVTNTATGCSQTAQCTLGISAMPTGTAVATEDFQNNQIITVTVSPVSNSYLFRLNGGPWQQSPVFSNASEGENIVEATDTKGCGTLTLPVYVLNYPRFFTPNGDGYNDTWNVSLPDENGSEIYIFDRMGKLLKSLKPSKDSGWDGTYNGKMLPASDYWFQLHYRDYQGGEKEFKAHFSLKR